METTLGSGRVEAFSDGVLAIAITLLVLDLHIGSTPGSVLPDLLEQWPEYVAYLASFVFIGVIWVNHHATYQRLVGVDTGLLWRNLVLLAATSILPFPTSQLAFAMNHGTHADQVAAIVLYALVSAGVGASWLLTYDHLHRHPRLLRADVPAGLYRAERWRAIAGIVSPFVPVLLSLWQPLLALALMALTPVFYAITANGLATVGSRARVRGGAEPR